jgi:hypothetical protein
VKPEDEQYEATLQRMYCEYGLKKYAQAQYINGWSFLASGMSQEWKATMLMGMRSQKQSAIETSMCSITFDMSDACTGGSKLQLKKAKQECSRG